MSSVLCSLSDLLEPWPGCQKDHLLVATIELYSRVPFTLEGKCCVAELGAVVLLHGLMGARVLKDPGITVQESGGIFLWVDASKEAVRRTFNWLQQRNQRLQLLLLYLPGVDYMASEKDGDV